MSPVAHLLAVGGNSQIVYYQAQTRELLGVLDYPEGRIEHVSFSRDGTWLVAAGGEIGKSGTVVVFDVETGKRVGNFDKHYDTVLSAAVSPDNATVAVGGTNAKVRAFDAYTGSKSYELLGHNDWIQAVEFSPDGLLLATADRAGGLYVWDSENGREMHQLRGHSAGVTALSFRPDSQVLASTGKDGTVRLWNMESGGQIRQWAAHSVASLGVEFAANGQIGTCGADGLTRLWDQEGKKLREFESQGDWVYSLAFTPDTAQIVAGTFSGTLALFETATGKLLGKLSTAP
jgi:WD40 repeat protein